MLEFLSDEPGTLLIPGSVVPSLPTFNPRIGSFLANVTFEIGDIRIENMDTIGDPLALLKPVFMRPFHLENSVGIGQGGTPVTTSVRLILNLTKVNENGAGGLGTRSPF